MLDKISPRLAALCAAFAAMNGLLSPGSDAYRLMNPLLLPAFSPKHKKDEKTGRRCFNSFSSGWDNSLIDLSIKCSGNSFSKIGPDSTLLDLVCLYGNRPPAARIVKNFLCAALNDASISESQPLSWFLESPQEDKE
jgi:hypothetical protein